MKTILITAYAVNPYKGSEEGTGWNLVCQAAKDNRVIAVTRKNNRTAIEQFLRENAGTEHPAQGVSFLYFDLPRWMIFWKKGPLLSALYFYCWQFFVAWWLKRKKLNFDIAHSLNFHSNWTPSFLWILGKPFVWGPVGNHPLIPVQYIRPVYGYGAYLKDRILWAMKCFFWYADPFVLICRMKAGKIICVNTQAAQKLRVPAHKLVNMPAVASELPAESVQSAAGVFNVLSVGRFVPLKGFDLTVRAFAKFFHALHPADKPLVRLFIAGSGPCKKVIDRIIKEEDVAVPVTLAAWMPRNEVVRMYSDTSVFLFPSHEGAGMVVAEALSYGKPVVCLDNYGPGEYIHPQSDLRARQGGYRDTVDDLAAKLMKLFTDKMYYRRESYLAYERYQQLFRWDVKGTVLNTIYEEMAPEQVNPVAKKLTTA